MSLYKTFVKPVLFLMSPENAHDLAKWSFKRQLIWKMLNWRLNVTDDRLHTKVGNLDMPNPVGLAAGFDKNCEMSATLFHMGFGYLTLGTVTRDPREGNPKPRMWRYPERSLVNSMGLPNRGIKEVTAKFSKYKSGFGRTVVSISGLSVEEIVECYRAMEPLADAVELNVSTPNTVGVRIFQQPEVLAKLLDAVARVRNHEKPVWVKIPPYFNEIERENVHNLVEVCVKASVDGLTATNTKLVTEPRASIGTGGLSGPLIYQDTLRIVADVYNHTGGKVPINACGGISSGLDAWKAFEAGASTVQLYTALVYEGPGIVSKINRELLRLLETSKLCSLSELVGSGLR